MDTTSMIKRCHLFLVLALAGCGTHKVPTAAVPALAISPEYLDLQSGWRLRVVFPLMKPGGSGPVFTEQRTAGNVIALKTSDDFLGYETAYYALVSERQDGVWVQFRSAEVTKDGSTVPEAQAPAMLSMPPRRMKYARLLYLLRVSESDHDMALLAAHRKEILNDETRRVQADPAACRTGDAAFCVWIPKGIAVRAEKLQSSNRQWVPAR
jgi:hypothetical protein